MERTRGLEVWHGTRCMGVTEPLKLFVCNIRKYILSYAILESTFVCIIRKYFLWPFSHLRAVLISVSHLRAVLISIGTFGSFSVVWDSM